MTPAQMSVRQLVIDWLDDNYHFGETEALLKGDDDTSLLKTGLLDSLGFIRLLLHIEQTCRVRIDRTALSPQNFDGVRKIAVYVSAMPDYRPSP